MQLVLRRYRFCKTFLSLPSFGSIDADPFDRRLIPGYLAATAFFSITLGLAWLLEPYLEGGYHFAMFFPVVIATAFIYGRYPAILCAALGATALLAWASHSSTGALTIDLAFYLVTSAINIEVLHFAYRALTALEGERLRAEDMAREREIFASELEHRIKNVFATASALVSLAARHAKTPQDLAGGVIPRLEALGRGAELLRGSERRRKVSTLLEAVLTPMVTKGTIDIDRASLDIEVCDASISAMSLIFHELAINASKYGALGSPKGRVTITGLESPQSLTIHWIETGANLPEDLPSRVGFGSSLMSSIASSLGGTLTFQYHPDGLVAVLTLPDA